MLSMCMKIKKSVRFALATVGTRTLVPDRYETFTHRLSCHGNEVRVEIELVILLCLSLIACNRSVTITVSDTCASQL